MALWSAPSDVLDPTQLLQIRYPVVGSFVVDVIERIARPIAVTKEPSQAMLCVQLSVDPYLSIAIVS
jgi:hypothetical protein